MTITQEHQSKARAVDSVCTRPIMRYHGGKWRLSDWIISQFPDHRCYVEPFAGAASVLLRKPRAKVEVLNDKYGRLVNAFRVLRDDASSARLARMLRFTPYSEEEYLACREVADDPVEDARRMIVLGHQAHGSTGATGAKFSGWRRSVRDRGFSSGDEWRILWEHVEGWSDRLRGVHMENTDACAVMKRWDAPDALHYVDPPYVAVTRTSSKTRGYAYEMTDEDHRVLAETLRSLEGAVIVSGYPSALYEELFAGWTRIEHKHVADRGAVRTEVLWMQNVDQGLFNPRN